MVNILVILSPLLGLWTLSSTWHWMAFIQPCQKEVKHLASYLYLFHEASTVFGMLVCERRSQFKSIWITGGCGHLTWLLKGRHVMHMSYPWLLFSKAKRPCSAQFILVSVSDITPTDRWLNVWCIWHTYLEKLHECQSRRRIGWIIQHFRETCVAFFNILPRNKEAVMPNPLTKEEIRSVYKCDGERLSGSTKRWIFKSKWNI